MSELVARLSGQRPPCGHALAADGGRSGDDLAVRVDPAAVHARPAALAVPLGLLAGAATGVAARAWMRVVSGDPEFTWSGTVSIIVLFAVVGLTQGVALAVRRRQWHRWAQLPLRLLAGLTALLIGSGAGIVMLPAIVFGSLAWARTDWPRWARTTAGAVAAANAVAMLWLLGGDLPLWRLIAGWLLMLPLYAVIIGGVAANLRPLPVRAPHHQVRISETVIATAPARAATPRT